MRLIPLSLSIRTKLVLVSTTLFIIPWIGTHYVQEMEDYLRQQQEDIALTRTATIASLLQSRPDVFTIQTSSPLPTRDVAHLFVRPLRHAIQLDGYLDDWASYSERILHYDQSHAIGNRPGSTLHFDLQMGSHRKYLYLAIKVFDDHVIYKKPNSADHENCDHLTIAMENRDGEFVTYVISTISPGWVNAQRKLPAQLSDDDTSRYESEIRIKGAWQENKGGYTIELRIPIELIGPKMSLAVTDVNNTNTRASESIVATAGISDASSLATIIFPSPEIEQLLTNLQRPLTRTWVIDKHNRVIAQTGSLIQQEIEDEDNYPPAKSKSTKSLPSRWTSFFYSLLLKQPSEEFHDDLLNASRLDSEEFRQALLGKPMARWRQTSKKETSILTATHPVYQNGQVIGAVAIEQTSNTILLLQNRAMEILFNISALAFLMSIIVLLSFATRLTIRIRRLRDTAEAAITPDGRVISSEVATQANDEIGDLSRSVADMLTRLSNYNRYLETMASKLSHELRTPITVVRSSLDNLDNNDLPPSTVLYLERAREGINRLNNILTRMSEATRLEQTLQSEQTQVFNLATVTKSCVASYNMVNSAHNIHFEIKNTHINFDINGVPELIAQMLDKLINNAVEFHHPGTPINVRLDANDDFLILTVSNSGPPLPDNMKTNLFDSMVSIRQHRDEQPHLGLGLYIVRLIVEFHQGSVSADNLSNNTGVVFTVKFPKLNHQN